MPQAFGVPLFDFLPALSPLSFTFLTTTNSYHTRVMKGIGKTIKAETGSDIGGVFYVSRVWLSTRCNRGTVKKLTTRVCLVPVNSFLECDAQEKKSDFEKNHVLCGIRMDLHKINSVNPKTDPQNIVDYSFFPWINITTREVARKNQGKDERRNA